jgi:hypothetical protein
MCLSADKQMLTPLKKATPHHHMAEDEWVTSSVHMAEAMVKIHICFVCLFWYCAPADLVCGCMLVCACEATADLPAVVGPGRCREPMCIFGQHIRPCPDQRLQPNVYQ